jgi:iron complex outermembrane receptor protein
VGYAAAHWHTALNLKNAFDRHYYAAGINDNAVGAGNLRTLMWTIGLDE